MNIHASTRAWAGVMQTIPNWSAIYRTGASCNAGPATPLNTPYVYPGSNIRGFDGAIATNQPLLAKNFDSFAFNSGTITVPPGGLVMHPGPNGECAILRYTVPAGGQGVYNVNSRDGLHNPRPSAS